METEERLANLESTVSFQDRTIQDLNQVILEQQERIARLEAKVEQLLQPKDPLVRDIADEEPPPHY